jgi:hypothetical protein
LLEIENGIGGFREDAPYQRTKRRGEPGGVREVLMKLAALNIEVLDLAALDSATLGAVLARPAAR